MKHTLTVPIFCLALLAAIALPYSPVAATAPATGQSTNQVPATGQTTNKVQTFTLSNPLRKDINSVGSLIQAFVEIFSYLVILFAVLALVWVGLQFILARGDAERMKELKNWLTRIVIGIAIVIGARVIVTVIINTLQATETVDKGTFQSVSNVINQR